MAHWDAWGCREESAKMFEKTIQGDQLGSQSWWELRQQAAARAVEERDQASLSLHSMVGLQTSNERLSNPAVEEHQGI